MKWNCVVDRNYNTKLRKHAIEAVASQSTLANSVQAEMAWIRHTRSITVSLKFVHTTVSIKSFVMSTNGNYGCRAGNDNGNTQS
jgi:hypothetical protein